MRCTPFIKSTYRLHDKVSKLPFQEGFRVHCVHGALYEGFPGPYFRGCVQRFRIPLVPRAQVLHAPELEPLDGSGSYVVHGAELRFTLRADVVCRLAQRYAGPEDAFATEVFKLALRYPQVRLHAPLGCGGVSWSSSRSPEGCLSTLQRSPEMSGVLE